MVHIDPSTMPILEEWLKRSAHRELLDGFDVDEADLEHGRLVARKQHPEFSAECRDAWAAFVAATHPHSHRQKQARAANEAPAAPPSDPSGQLIPTVDLSSVEHWLQAIFVVLMLGLLILGLLVVPGAHGEPPKNAYINEGRLRAAVVDAMAADTPAIADAPIIKVSNGGSVLATIPAGVVIFDCGTNMSCSWTANTHTFSMAASSTAATAFSAITASANSNAGTFSGIGNGWDFTGTTIFKLRVGAGLTTSANGDIGYDTTATAWHVWQGADRFLITSTNLGTSGQYFKSNANGSGGFGAIVASDIPAGNSCAANSFANSLGSALTLGCAQPSFANLSGSLTLGQTPLTTLGDLLYVNATPALARLAGNTTTSKQFLTQTGTGTVSAAPTWGTIVAADIPTGTSCPANQYANSLGSALTLSCAQVAYSQVSGTPSLFYQTVQNASGTDQTQRGKIEFTGSAVSSVTDDAANNRTVVTLTASAGSGVTLQTNGVNNASQTALNLLNSAVTNGLTLTHTNTSGGNVQLGLSGTLTVPGGGTGLSTLAAHQLYVGNGTSTPNPVPAGNAGQVLISNGASADPTFQDPIVSQAYMNLFNAVSATATQTSANVRNPIFSQTGTFIITWASITGSPSGCTIQVKGVDSLGNAVNNGTAFSVSPANGTTSQAFSAAATLLTAAQMAVTYSCSTYPTAGTLTLDYAPQGSVVVGNFPATQNVSVTNTPNVTIQSNASVNLNQVGGSAFAQGQRTMANSLSIVPASDYSSPDTVGTSGALNALNAAASVALNAQQGVGVFIASGTLVGTVVPEVSYDGGTTWVSSFFFDPTARTVSSSLVLTNPSPATTLTILSPGGSSNARVRVSSFTSGTATATLRATMAKDNTLATQPVSGTVTVQPGNTANTTPWLTTDSATSATGSAVPSKAAYIGGNSSGNLTGIIACDSSVFLDMATATTTQLVALSSGKSIYICSYDIQSNGTASVKLVYGTGSNCGTGTTQLTSNLDLTAQTGLSRGSGLGMLAKTAASNALCATSSAAVNVHVDVTYTQF